MVYMVRYIGFLFEKIYISFTTAVYPYPVFMFIYCITYLYEKVHILKSNHPESTVRYPRHASDIYTQSPE